MLEQKKSTPREVAALLVELVEDVPPAPEINAALALWHAPNAAREQSPSTLLRQSPKTGPQRRTEVDFAGFNAGARPARKNCRRMTLLDAPALADQVAGCVSSARFVRRDEPMARHTTLRVGGPADVYVEPAEETDLAALLKFCGAHGVTFFILGRGSNLLVRDGGFRGAVICLAQPEFSRIAVDGGRLRCGAGARLKNVAVEARRHGVSGLEFLDGIPGSIGGALRMNAGAMGSATFDVVESVRVMDFDGRSGTAAARPGGGLSRLRDVERSRWRLGRCWSAGRIPWNPSPSG